MMPGGQNRSSQPQIEIPHPGVSLVARCRHVSGNARLSRNLAHKPFQINKPVSPSFWH